MEIREVLKNLREKNHLTQDQMAERVMVTRQAVSRWENGDTQPNTETLKLLSKEFDVSINTLLGSPLTTDDLVIIELKRDGLCPSPILQMLRDLRIFPHGFSKYCMGMALTDPSLPKNRIKLKLIEVEKTLWRDGASLYPQK